MSYNSLSKGTSKHQLALVRVARAGNHTNQSHLKTGTPSAKISCHACAQQSSVYSIPKFFQSNICKPSSNICNPSPSFKVGLSFSAQQVCIGGGIAYIYIYYITIYIYIYSCLSSHKPHQGRHSGKFTVSRCF